MAISASNMLLHDLDSGRKKMILFTSLLLGIFLVIQSRSFIGVTIVNTRDSASNMFRELQVLRDTNKSLTDETGSLEEVLAKSKDSSLSLKALEDEIRRFKTITGGLPVYGPGIRVSVPVGTEVASLVDLINELFNTGAEAVSLNGIRLTGNGFGLDGIPSGQILLKGNILQPPYILTAIGDSLTMENTLRQVGGFLRRYEKKHPGKTLKIEKKDRIDMDKVD